MVVTEVGMETEDSEEHAEKALSLTEMTEVGMEMEDRETQS